MPGGFCEGAFIVIREATSEIISCVIRLSFRQAKYENSLEMQKPFTTNQRGITDATHRKSVFNE